MSRRRRNYGKADQLLQGVLLVDKPVGMTSHEVCQRVKHRMRLGKVGHGGTLDPFATGLLPLLLNGATRLMPSLQSSDKVYEATVRLGIRTDTMDPTGEEIARGDVSGVNEAMIRDGVASFQGEQEQTIPRYAAARVDGKHLYEYARAGEEVELPTKTVTMHSLDVLSIERGEDTVDVRLRVHCTTGTYVRALADDLGTKLGCTGYLHELRRLSTGGLTVDGSITLDAIDLQARTWRDARQERLDAGETVPFVAIDNTRAWRGFLGTALLPVSQLLGGVPTFRLPPELQKRVASGQPLRKGELGRSTTVLESQFRPGDRMVVEDEEGVRGVAVVRAAVARDSLSRREDNAIVFEVDRVLR